MPPLKLTSFSGMWPVRDIRALPDNAAASAVNIWPDGGGAIKGVNAPRFIKTLQPDTRCVYRIPVGDPKEMDDAYWMEFEDPETMVVRTPISNDQFERYYWASPSEGLKYAPKALIEAGFAGYLVGVTPPVGAPTVAPVPGTGAIDPDTGLNTLPKVTRSYLVTFESLFGEESIPSQTVEAQGAPDQDWLITNIPQPVADPDRIEIRAITIYRTVTSASGVATFFKVEEVNVGVTFFNDTKSDAVVTGQTQLQSVSFAPPPEGLEGIIAMPNGILVGWIGNDIYFSENYRPHAWPPEYQVTVEHRVVGMGVFGNTAVICTEGQPATVSGVRSNAMSLTKNNIALPCLSRRSIVTAPQGVIYASNNGLILFGPGGLDEVTNRLIGRETWSNEFLPDTIRAVFTEGKYIAMTDEHDAVQGFMFSPTDPTKEGVTWLDVDGEVDIGMDDYSGRSWFIRDGSLYEFSPPETPGLEYRWRSKEFHLAAPVNMSVVQVFYTGVGYTGRVRVWATLRGAEAVSRQLIFDEPYTMSGREMRLPAGFKADIWQVEVTGEVEVQAVHMASSVMELRGV